MDSGSTDCFVDSRFVDTYKLPFQKIAPLSLTLIDGTVNQYVSCVVMLPMQLSLGYSFVCELYVTKLDNLHPIVLGHNWLVSHNPTINWEKGTLNLSKETPRTTNPAREEPEHPEVKKPSISFINTPAFQRACRTPGAMVLQLTPDHPGLQA